MVAIPISINKQIEVIPSHKELEYKRQQSQKPTWDKYTIPRLYDASKIKALSDKANFIREADALKQILLDFGKNAIFTPLISNKALNLQTVELLTELQKSAGFESITILESNINESVDDMELYFESFAKKFGKDKIYPMLDNAISVRNLFSDKLEKLKGLGFSEVGVTFSGYWKYLNNMSQLLTLDSSRRPQIMCCNVWNKLRNVPLSVVVALFNVEKVSCGFRLMFGTANKKILHRLDEAKIEYKLLDKAEIMSLQKTTKAINYDELYSYLRAEAYDKNKQIIQELSKLDTVRLKAVISSKLALATLLA